MGSSDQAGDRVGRIEVRGVEHIPVSERTSKPSEPFWAMGGAQFCLNSIIIGWIPITLGLGWWDAFTSTTVGVLVGSVLFAPVAMMGPKTGTTSSVSSGAYFGVVGRVLGSLLSAVNTLGFYAMAIWTGGDAIVATCHKMLGTPTNSLAYVLSFLLMMTTTVLLAIYGHATVVRAQKILIPTIGGVMILGVIITAGHFDPGYSGTGEYLLGSLSATWALSAIAGCSIAIVYAPYINDYARYIPPTAKPATVACLSGLGMFLGCWITFIFGAFIATMFPPNVKTWAEGWVEMSPLWFMPPILIVAVIGSFAQGALILYSEGLDMSSLVPRLRRVPATLALSSVSLAFAFIGFFVWNLADAVASFVVLLVVITTPWTVIIVLGHFMRRGWYNPADLQVFNERRKGGIYWYTRGWNLRSVAAWAPSTALGVMFVQTDLYTGPWATVAHGIDMSVVSAGISAAILYLIITRIFPEPVEVRGPSLASNREIDNKPDSIDTTADSISSSSELLLEPD